jgi:hypothetical protein
MTPVIATAQMTRTRPDGSKTTITVEVGAALPMPPETGISGYYSTARILGIQMDDHVDWSNGVDSAQAVSLSLCWPGAILSELPFAQEIDLSVVPNFGFPMMPALVHHAPRTEAD